MVCLSLLKVFTFVTEESFHNLASIKSHPPVIPWSWIIMMLIMIMVMVHSTYWHTFKVKSLISNFDSKLDKTKKTLSILISEKFFVVWLFWLSCWGGTLAICKASQSSLLIAGKYKCKFMHLKTVKSSE